MKKFSLILTGLFFGVAFALCTFTGCSVGTYSYSRAGAYTAGSGSVSADGVTSISVDWIGGDVTISPSWQGPNEISFSEETEEADEDYLLHSAVIDGELKIKFQKSGTRNKNNFSKKLTVTVPHDMILRALETETVSGDVNVWTISATDAEIETVSGDVNLYYLAAGSLSVESVSGDISVYTSGACHADFETVSGDVSIDTEATGFRVSYETVSGTVSNRCGAVKNGKAYSYGDEAFQASVETVSGNLELNFSEPASPDV